MAFYPERRLDALLAEENLLILLEGLDEVPLTGGSGDGADSGFLRSQPPTPQKD